MRHSPKGLFFMFALFFIACFISCAEKTPKQPGLLDEQQLTIFFVNDMHGQLDNFAKIKHIVNAEKAVSNVLLVSGGDIFSGNPIVDQYSEKGYPIIDIMNKTGFDVSVVGNHEFDYGLSILNDRLSQAEFKWVCANLDTQSSGLTQPEAYTTVAIGNLSVTFLGLVETNGKPDDIIPSTHPWRVEGLSFQRFYDVVPQYQGLKNQENADLYVALTHLGSNADYFLANDHPYFDVIIGGHSNDLNQETVNGIPVLMAGNKLSHLGKIKLIIKDKEVFDYSITLIELDSYPDVDQELMDAIEVYNSSTEFAEVVGEASSYHGKNELGCFYTTALKEYMQVDFSFQNGGGIRADIDQGDITTLEIYNMDPFNNQSVVFTMTAAEIKDFFKSTGVGLHVTGITLQQQDDEIIIFDEGGNEINDSAVLTLGTNDYIPAVYDQHFSLTDADIKELTSAETLIQYLKTINSTVAFEGCNHYFRYQ